MRCPFCRADSRVVDTREVGNEIRRRSECNVCQQRFTTYERLAAANIMVIKRDGRREEFNRDKLRRSILLALTKRPVSLYAVESLVSEVEAEL